MWPLRPVVAIWGLLVLQHCSQQSTAALVPGSPEKPFDTAGPRQLSALKPAHRSLLSNLTNCDSSVPTIVLRITRPGEASVASTHVLLDIAKPFNLSSASLGINVQGAAIGIRACDICSSTAPDAYLGATGSTASARAVCQANSAVNSGSCARDSQLSENMTLSVSFSSYPVLDSTVNAQVFDAQAPVSGPAARVHLLISAHLSADTNDIGQIAQLQPNFAAQFCLRSDVLITPNADTPASVRPHLPSTLLDQPLARLVLVLGQPAAEAAGTHALQAVLPRSPPLQPADAAAAQGMPLRIFNPHSQELMFSVRVPEEALCWLSIALNPVGPLASKLGISAALAQDMVRADITSCLLGSEQTQRFPDSVLLVASDGSSSCITGSIPAGSTAAVLVIAQALLPLQTLQGLVHVATWWNTQALVTKPLDPRVAATTIVAELPAALSVADAGACGSSGESWGGDIAPPPTGSMASFAVGSLLVSTGWADASVHMSAAYAAQLGGILSPLSGLAGSVCGNLGTKQVQGGSIIGNGSLNVDTSGVDASTVISEAIATWNEGGVLGGGQGRTLAPLLTSVSGSDGTPGQLRVSVNLDGTAYRELPLGQWSLRMMLVVASPAAWDALRVVRPGLGGEGGVKLSSGGHGAHAGLLNTAAQQILLIPHTVRFTAGCGLPFAALSWGGVWSSEGGVNLGDLPSLLHESTGEAGGGLEEASVLAQPPVFAVGGLLLRDSFGRPASLHDCTAHFTVPLRVLAASVQDAGMVIKRLNITFTLVNGSMSSRTSISSIPGVAVVPVDGPSLLAAAEQAESRNTDSLYMGTRHVAAPVGLSSAYVPVLSAEGSTVFLPGDSVQLSGTRQYARAVLDVSGGQNSTQQTVVPHAPLAFLLCIQPWSLPSNATVVWGGEGGVQVRIEPGVSWGGQGAYTAALQSAPVDQQGNAPDAAVAHVKAVHGPIHVRPIPCSAARGAGFVSVAHGPTAAFLNSWALSVAAGEGRILQVQPAQNCACTAGFGGAAVSSVLRNGVGAAGAFILDARSVLGGGSAAIMGYDLPALSALQLTAGALVTPLDMVCTPCAQSSYSNSASLLLPILLQKRGTSTLSMLPAPSIAQVYVWMPPSGQGCLPCPGGKWGPQGGVSLQSCAPCFQIFSSGQCGRWRSGGGHQLTVELAAAVGSNATSIVVAMEDRNAPTSVVYAGHMVSPNWMPWAGAVPEQAFVLDVRAADDPTQPQTSRLRPVATATPLPLDQGAPASSNSSGVVIGYVNTVGTTRVKQFSGPRSALARRYVQEQLGKGGVFKGATAYAISAAAAGWWWVEQHFLQLPPSSARIGGTTACPNMLACMTVADLTHDAPTPAVRAGFAGRGAGGWGNLVTPVSLPSLGRNASLLPSGGPPDLKQRMFGMCVEGSGLEGALDVLAWGAGMRSSAALYMPTVTSNTRAGPTPEVLAAEGSPRAGGSAFRQGGPSAPWLSGGGVYGGNGSMVMCAVCGHGYEHASPVLGAMSSCLSCKDVSAGTAAGFSIAGVALGMLLVIWWVVQWADLVFESGGKEAMPALSLVSGLEAAVEDESGGPTGDWVPATDTEASSDDDWSTAAMSGAGAPQARVARFMFREGDLPSGRGGAGGGAARPKSVYLGASLDEVALQRAHVHRLQLLQRQWSRLAAPVLMAAVPRRHKVAAVPPRQAADTVQLLEGIRQERRTQLDAYSELSSRASSHIESTTGEGSRAIMRDFRSQHSVSIQRWWAALQNPHQAGSMTPRYFSVHPPLPGQPDTLPSVPPGESWITSAADGVAHVSTAFTIGGDLGGAEVTSRGVPPDDAALSLAQGTEVVQNTEHGGAYGEGELWSLAAEALLVESQGDTWRGTDGVRAIEKLDPPLGLQLDEIAADVFGKLSPGDDEEGLGGVAEDSKLNAPPAPVTVTHPHRRVRHTSLSKTPTGVPNSPKVFVFPDEEGATAPRDAPSVDARDEHSGVLLQPLHSAPTGHLTQVQQAGGMSQHEIDQVAQADPLLRLQGKGCQECSVCRGWSSPPARGTPTPSDPFGVAGGPPALCSALSAGTYKMAFAAWRLNTLPRAVACLDSMDIAEHGEDEHTIDVAEAVVEAHEVLCEVQLAPRMGESVQLAPQMVFTGAPGLWRRRVMNADGVLRRARHRVLKAGEAFHKEAKRERRRSRRSRTQSMSGGAPAERRTLGPSQDSTEEVSKGGSWTLEGGDDMGDEVTWGGAADTDRGPSMFEYGAVTKYSALHSGLLRFVASTLLLQQVITFLLLSHSDVECPSASPDAIAAVDSWWNLQGGDTVVSEIEKRLEDQSLDVPGRKLELLRGLPPALGLSPLQILRGQSPVGALRDLFAGVLLVPVHSFRAACALEREQSSAFSSTGGPLLAAALCIVVLGALGGGVALHWGACWLSERGYDALQDIEEAREEVEGPQDPEQGPRPRVRADTACGLSARPDDHGGARGVQSRFKGACTARDGQSMCYVRCVPWKGKSDRQVEPVRGVVHSSNPLAPTQHPRAQFKSTGGCMVPSIYCHDVTIAAISMTVVMLLPALWHACVMALPSFSTGLARGIRRMMITQRIVENADEKEEEALRAVEAEQGTTASGDGTGGSLAAAGDDEEVEVDVVDAFLNIHPGTPTGTADGAATSIMAGFVGVAFGVALLALVMAVLNGFVRPDITGNAKVDMRRIPSREGTYARLLRHVTREGHVDLRWWLVNLAAGGWYAAWLPLRARDVQQQQMMEAAEGGEGGVTNEHELPHGPPSGPDVDGAPGSGRGAKGASDTIATPTGTAAMADGGSRFGMTYGEWILRMWRRFGWMWGALAPESWFMWVKWYHGVLLLLPLVQVGIVDPSTRACAALALMITLGIAHEMAHPYVHRQEESGAADPETTSLFMVPLHVDMAPPRSALLEQLLAQKHTLGLKSPEMQLNRMSDAQLFAMLRSSSGGESATRWSTASGQLPGGSKGGGQKDEAPPELVGVEYNAAQAELHHWISSISIWSSVLQALLLAVPAVRLALPGGYLSASVSTSGNVCYDYGSSLAAFISGTGGVSWVPTPGVSDLGGVVGKVMQPPTGPFPSEADADRLYAHMHRLSWLLADVATARSLAVVACVLPVLFLAAFAFSGRSGHVAFLWCGDAVKQVRGKCCTGACSTVGFVYDFVDSVLLCGFCRAVCCRRGLWGGAADGRGGEDILTAIGMAPDPPAAAEVWRWLESVAFIGRTIRGWADGGHPAAPLTRGLDYVKGANEPYLAVSNAADEADSLIWHSPRTPRRGSVFVSKGGRTSARGGAAPALAPVLSGGKARRATMASLPSERSCSDAARSAVSSEVPLQKPLSMFDVLKGGAGGGGSAAEHKRAGSIALAPQRARRQSSILSSGGAGGGSTAPTSRASASATITTRRGTVLNPLHALQEGGEGGSGRALIHGTSPSPRGPARMSAVLNQVARSGTVSGASGTAAGKNDVRPQVGASGALGPPRRRRASMGPSMQSAMPPSALSEQDMPSKQPRASAVALPEAPLEDSAAGVGFTPAALQGITEAAAGGETGSSERSPPMEAAAMPAPVPPPRTPLAPGPLPPPPKRRSQEDILQAAFAERGSAFQNALLGQVDERTKRALTLGSKGGAGGGVITPNPLQPAAAPVEDFTFGGTTSTAASGPRSGAMALAAARSSILHGTQPEAVAAAAGAGVCDAPPQRGRRVSGGGIDLGSVMLEDTEHSSKMPKKSKTGKSDKKKKKHKSKRSKSRRDSGSSRDLDADFVQDELDDETFVHAEGWDDVPFSVPDAHVGLAPTPPVVNGGGGARSARSKKSKKDKKPKKDKKSRRSHAEQDVVPGSMVVLGNPLAAAAAAAGGGQSGKGASTEYVEASSPQKSSKKKKKKHSS